MNDDSGIGIGSQSPLGAASSSTVAKICPTPVSPRHKTRRLENPTPQPRPRLEPTLPRAPIDGITGIPAKSLARLDTPAHLGTGAKFLDDVVVNHAVSNLVRWVIGTKSNTLAVDSLLPIAEVLSTKRRHEITENFTDHDVLYLPIYIKSAKHWLLYRAHRHPIKAVRHGRASVDTGEVQLSL